MKYVLRSIIYYPILLVFLVLAGCLEIIVNIITLIVSGTFSISMIDWGYFLSNFNPKLYINFIKKGY